jgi:hypothetical protein
LKDREGDGRIKLRCILRRVQTKANNVPEHCL